MGFRHGIRGALCAVAFGLILCGLGRPASAQDFYAGKVVTIVFGFPADGPAGNVAQLYARHFGRFVPGHPEVVADHAPGQGGNLAAIRVATAAGNDGTVLGIVGSGPIWSAILGYEKPLFDVRQLNWIGARVVSNVVCIARKESGIRYFEDARRNDVRLGVTQQGTRTSAYARLLNDLTATKFRFVEGFANIDAILRAMEEGKVDAHCGSTIEALRQRVPSWFEQGIVNVLVQFALNPDDSFPDTPRAFRIPKTNAGKRVMVFLASDSVLGQAVMAPPGVPAERIQILRRAFDAMWRDQTVLEEAAKLKIRIDPAQGEAIQDFVAQLHGAPDDVRWIVQRVLRAK